MIKKVTCSSQHPKSQEKASFSYYRTITVFSLTLNQFGLNASLAPGREDWFVRIQNNYPSLPQVLQLLYPDNQQKCCKTTKPKCLIFC